MYETGLTSISAVDGSAEGGTKAHDVPAAARTAADSILNTSFIDRSAPDGTGREFKPTRREAIGSVLAGFAVGIGAARVTAAEDAAAGPKDSRPVQGLTRQTPARASNAKYVFDKEPFGEMRAVVIKEQGDEVSGKALYSHFPLLAFCVNPSPYQGYPPIVQKVTPTADGAILRFSVQLTSEEFKTACGKKVIEDDFLLKDTQKSEAAIAVEPVAVVGARARFFNRSDKERIVSCWAEKWLDRTAELNVRMSQAQIERFKELWDSNELMVTWDYSPVLSEKHKAEITREGRRSLELENADTLQSNQLAGNAPIFQGEEEQFKNFVKQEVDTLIQIDSERLQPYLAQVANPSRLDQMLSVQEELTLQQLESRYPDVKAQLAAYLAPRLKSVQKSAAEQNVQMNLSQTMEGEQSQFGGNMSVSIPIKAVSLGFGLSGSHASFKSVLDQVQRATGVTYAWSETEQCYLPHSVKFCAVQKGSSLAMLRETTRLVLNLTGNSFWVSDRDIPAHFTDIVVEELLRKNGNVLPSRPDLFKENGALKERTKDLEKALKDEKEAHDKTRAELEEKVKTIKAKEKTVESQSKTIKALNDRIERLNMQIEAMRRNY